MRIGKASLIMLKVPPKSVATTALNSSKLSSSTRPSFIPIPAALLINTSMRPNFSATSVIKLCIESVFVKSNAWNHALPPSAVISSTTFCPRSTLRPVMTTVAASLAQSFAIPIPIPLVEPVTMITLSFKRSILNLLKLYLQITKQLHKIGCPSHF